MEYQININHQFTAESQSDAQAKAKQYIRVNLTVRQLRTAVLSPHEVARQCKSFRKAKKEHFCVFLLDTQNRIIAKDVVSVGTLNSSLVHPRECFRMAILKSASSIIIAHNHPGGSLEPSAEDLDVTKRLTDCGKLLGVEVLDHLIVTAESYVSLREKNLFY
jgi:DNA repair protein RadC